MYAVVGPESEGFENWNDADGLGAELGATHAPYPAAPLVITAPGDESGTYDTFVELVIEDIVDERGQSAEIALRSRPGVILQATVEDVKKWIAG